MKRYVLCVIALLFTVTVFAQGFRISKMESGESFSYEQIRLNPPMKWSCPEVEKYQGILASLRSDDYKAYADKVKSEFELYTDPSEPSHKYIVTQGILTIDNPAFEIENLLDHLTTWVKSYKGISIKKIEVDAVNKRVMASLYIPICSHSSFMAYNKVGNYSTLALELIEKNKFLVHLMTDTFHNEEYGSDNKLRKTMNPQISEVYPFEVKSAYKITYAKAYVGTYNFYWSFISTLRADLNKNFVRDDKLISQLHYAYQKDSLMAKYGEPTKVIAEKINTPDVNNEIHFYEQAQKIIIMGTTINFKDIMSCEIVDDPKFIPGRSTTSGLGFSIFGIGIGGTETTRTADKTIHNYVVNIKIDSMKTPLVRIATGQNEDKAEEIASTVEYILRHQQSNNGTKSQKSTTVTRRTRR